MKIFFLKEIYIYWSLLLYEEYILNNIFLI